MWTTIGSDARITIPGSSIKSPGSLLSMVKTEIPRSTSSSSELEIDIERNLDEISSASEEHSILEVHRKNSRSPTSLYQDYVTILSQYNIQVKNFLNSQQASLILSQIIQEVIQLPQSFVRKLQLQITMNNQPDVFNEKGFFRSEDLLSEMKVSDKFYRLLFEHVLGCYPSLITLWQDEDDGLDEEERRKVSTQIAKIHQIESAFYAVMQNRKHPKMKSDINKLKKILINLDPICFSQEWFKEKNHELKKKFKVQFNV